MQLPQYGHTEKTRRGELRKIPCRAASGTLQRGSAFPWVTTSVTKQDEKFSKRENTLGKKVHQSLGRAAFGQAENLGEINDNKTQWLGWATKERVGEPFSLLINVTFTISFVSLHIHSDHLPNSHCHSAHLSLTLIISTRSGCIRK